MKGVLICGGLGTRLRPLTEITNKSLLPVYDEPLITYPLRTLLEGGINDILVISGPEHIDQITSFLGSGARYGCSLAFKVQDQPKGIAHALALAEEFIDGHSVCAILGDNIFFDSIAPQIHAFESGAHIFLREVPDPERFGVAEVKGETVLSIEEKPSAPRSNLAQTGCYLYDNSCFDIIRSLEPSSRGELEITDVTKAYLKSGTLRFTRLQDEWIDAGTFETLHQAAVLVRERKLKPHAATIKKTFKAAAL